MNATAPLRSLYVRFVMLATTSLLVLASAGCAMFGSAAPASVSNGAWVDARGMSLYTYARDAVGRSACVAACAKNWPPLVATAADRPSGDWTIIIRDDGSLQWAYKGRPIYGWIKDMKPGDRTGDGWNQVWNLARP
jgi:predicted lipoprotein with Yx(FWY)xxD motif